MKIFTTILIVIALVLVGYNCTMLNFNNLTQGKGMIALIGIIASFCAICILVIFKMSKKIEQNLKNN